jgi:PAS domain S-box-containing protein
MAASLPSFFERFPLALALLSSDGAVVSCNPKLEVLLGTPRDQLLGARLVDLMHPADVDSDLDPLLLRHLKEVTVLERRFIVGEESVRTFKLTLSPWEDDRARVLAVLEDVTDARRRELERKKATKVMEEVLERVSDGFVALDRDWHYVYLNTEGARLLGRTPEQLLGKHIWTEFPDGVGQPFHLAYERAMKEQVPVAFEDYYPPFDHWFENRVYPSPDGVTIYFHNTTEKVRARKEGERLAKQIDEQRQWLEALLRGMPAPLVLIDLTTGKLAFANDAARETAGDLLTPDGAPSLPQTSHCTDEGGRLLHQHQLPQARAARGEEFEGFLVNWHSRDGVRTLLYSVVRLPAMSGQTPTAVMTFQDITRLKQTEDHLQAAVRSREEFLSAAAHELKTPITAMSLQLQSLARDLDTRAGTALDGVRPRVGAIRGVLSRLTRLVDNLLDLSRIRGGRLEFQPEELDAVQVARDVLVRLRPELERTGSAQLLRAEGPAVGHWDRLRLEQIVTNLVTNAAKYGMGKPVEVTVGTSGERLRLAVQDHGIGISAEDQARIFQPFERAEAARHYGGMGLGLWIVHELIERMGGVVSVSSETGKGSTFVVELPRARGVPSPRSEELAQHANVAAPRGN